MFALAAVAAAAYSQTTTQAGYTIVTADTGTTVPVGMALFSYTNLKGTLISQAGVAAAEPILSGRIFVDQVGTETAIALVNPGQQEANVKFTLRDANGLTVTDPLSKSLKAGNHQPVFVSQLFPSLLSKTDFIGSLTFESDQKLAAITLRQTPRGDDVLYAALPVVDLSSTATSQTLVFPQIAAGDGYTTQLVLINTTAQILTGKIALIGSDAAPLTVNVNGSSSSQFSYSIEPQGVYRAEFDRPAGLGVGYAVLTPDAGTTSPSGSVIFRFEKNGSIVTEAGVAATTATTSARIFVDNAGSYTGIAIANPSTQQAIVTFTTLDRFGSTVDSTSKTLPAGGHTAIFAHELVPGLSASFTGLLEIDSTVPVVPVTLKLTTNADGDSILTTLPVADLSNVSSRTSVIFSQIAIGGGFSTRLIFINTDKNKTAKGTLGYFKSDGTAMTVPQGGATASSFNYEVVAGGGAQFLPGNSDSVARITILYSLSDLAVSEISVNEGQSVRPSLLVLDSAGRARDDFTLVFSSLSTDVASVDSTGLIQAKKAGFSSLTITSGNVVATGTITVVTVSSGVTGFEATGVAQDLAKRIYLANSKDNSIMLAKDLSQTPEVYAGVPKSAGLKNDVRLQSLFRGPSYLAFDQAQANLYVSDAANSVIRTVYPGTTGKVETLSGTGQTGAADGTLTAATFNNPQGVALDTRGNLWVVDSGNHVIRRINLTKKTVETIAGKAGSSGSQDGTGSSARFNSPTGIALETEPLAQQLERELSGEAPPAVSLIVADTGNGVLRRVKETGEVETLRPSSTSTGPGAHGSSSPSTRHIAASFSFESPAGVYVDPVGNIYVSEPSANRVRVILRSGDLVPVSQADTFSSPRGIVITQSGRVVITDSSRAREIAYGAPQITGVTPDHISSKGGDKITIKGKNFSPDTILVAANVVISDRKILDTETITFTAPAISSGQTNLTVQNRGGLAQKLLVVESVPLLFQPQGYITTVVGGSTFAGDGSKAVEAPVSGFGITQDTEGNILIVDGLKNGVRRIDARTGVITTIAGNGSAETSGDGGPAIAAGIFPVYPGSSNIVAGIAIDSSGNVLVADNQRIRRIAAATGIINTIAGGEYGSCGDGGDATKACLGYPQGIAFDRSGNLYIADAEHRIRRVDASTGIISTFAGTGDYGFSGDNGPAASAEFDTPTGIAFDAAGNLYIADTRNYRIRKVDALTRVVSTFAGDGDGGYTDELGDNGPAAAAHIVPLGIAIDKNDNMFVADGGNNRIRRIDASTRVITTVAGNGSNEYSGDDGPATAAGLNAPNAITIDAAGNIFITDTGNFRIRKIDAGTGIITTVGGSGQARFPDENGPASLAALLFPSSIAIDTDGNLLIADATSGGLVRKVDASTGVITTIAGGGGPQEGNGDGGPALKATLTPQAIAFDSDRNIYLADTFDNRIRKIDRTTGTISTVVGTGEGGFTGDGGSAASATVDYPTSIAVDARGNLYISDSNNRRIRKVNLATGIITTAAGGGQPGQGIGDGGAATQASLGTFTRVAVDASGNLFIVDADNLRIRKVDASTQVITTAAGGGDSIDEGISATSALLYPSFVAFDKNGNMFVVDESLNCVRKIDGATQKITTVAGGNYRFGFAGDNGAATDATLGNPRSIVFDSLGNLYIADTENQRIRAIRGPIQ